MNHNVYSSPLTDRYAGAEMSYIWSPQFKHSTWRRLWLELAKCEQKLGLAITDGQIKQMSEHLEDIDFDRVAAKEKELRHDVMSHIHVFGESCPDAMPIIHLGATSCFVTDNTELIQMREGMKVLRGKLLKLMDQLAAFCERNKALPTLGFTHYQPAQLTTVGKRFSLYLQDFMLDFERLEREIEELPFRSVKGTTGTQASFLELFDGDHAKCRKLEKSVAAAMGFDRVIAVSGQTYTRKIDYFVMSILSGIAQSAAKMATDIRLLANLKEVEEPFEKKQIGSSAMAYKRNPMRSERVCSLARYVMNLPGNAAMTESTQWFERTLDDSANRRIILGEGFLTVDIILSLLINITDGLQLWPNVIRKHIQAELPFMATENLLMAAVKKGGNRQELHEVIRTHSMAAARRVKEEGADNDLLERLKSDPAFNCIRDEFDSLLDPATFVGRAPQQVQEFLAEEIRPILERYGKELSAAAADSVNV
ncbi:adenylosuccinate lyase [Victivallis lenta]|uniref:adenylosuccinate lyase n=1 Tax=Victivallis lenta TaxID=2606640 RepID=UPI002357690A|nr:adenylosuccinate lyase [Victivallis lenta]